MHNIVLASKNSGKLHEMQMRLQDKAIQLQMLADFTQHQADETGLTFVENAIIKARYAAQISGFGSTS